jgi:hypothetical protein
MAPKKLSLTQMRQMVASQKTAKPKPRQRATVWAGNDTRYERYSVLKPCPFGTKHKTTHVSFLEGTVGETHYIKCEDPSCLVLGPRAKTKALAITKWNTRH